MDLRCARGKDRGGHAYKDNQEFIVALSGSFDVVLDDGHNKQTFTLNRSYCGLLVPKGMWRTMTNFSTNSLALVLSSTEYDENDYIMDYNEFKQWRINSSQQTVSPDAKTSIVANRGRTMFQAGEGKSVFDCSLCELNKMHDPEGNLTYMYENIHVPFPINRVFYSYDIPGGEDRGAHAHKECHQFIIAASGAFEVVLDDGTNKRTVQLNRPFWGSMFHLAFGHQNKDSRREVFVWFWRHMDIQRMTMFAIIRIILTISD